MRLVYGTIPRYFNLLGSHLIRLIHFESQICVLDEPSNFLDREALGGLAVAIRDWAGAVVRMFATVGRGPQFVDHSRFQVIISHNEEFVTALCKEFRLYFRYGI